MIIVGRDDGVLAGQHLAAERMFEDAEYFNSLSHILVQFLHV